jgi:hypothetical protein
MRASELEQIALGLREAPIRRHLLAVARGDAD